MRYASPKFETDLVRTAILIRLLRKKNPDKADKEERLSLSSLSVFFFFFSFFGALKLQVMEYQLARTQALLIRLVSIKRVLSQIYFLEGPVCMVGVDAFSLDFLKRNAKNCECLEHWMENAI